MPSDLELLAIEIDTLWLKDDRGRLLKSQNAQARPAPYVLAGVSTEGWTLAFGSDVPDAVVEELQAAFDAEPPAADPSKPPVLFARCKQLLESALGEVESSGGPSYVVPPETSFESGAALLRSDDEHKERLRTQDLERLNWTAEEWRHLVRGDLGPWAFIMNGDRVASICHTARLTERGAEAGVWTDPDVLGRGYAAAATAAWASLFAPGDRHLFYSTGADNLSSQRVAARLNLPLIGWIWRLSSHEPGVAGAT